MIVDPVTIQKQIFNTSSSKDTILKQIFYVMCSLLMVILIGILGKKFFDGEDISKQLLIPIGLFLAITAMNKTFQYKLFDI